MFVQVFISVVIDDLKRGRAIIWYLSILLFYFTQKRLTLWSIFILQIIFLQTEVVCYFGLLETMCFSSFFLFLSTWTIVSSAPSVLRSDHVISAITWLQESEQSEDHIKSHLCHLFFYSFGSCYWSSCHSELSDTLIWAWVCVFIILVLL